MLALFTRRLARPSPRRPAPRPTFRPVLEPLEDRLTLSGQSLTSVADTTAYPSSAVVELDVDFHGHVISASGAMIDATHVLTAAHVLYNPALGGLADAVTVYAGRNGQSVEPFGVAHGTHWVVHGSYVSGTFAGQADYDLGLVTLDRPLGNMTGYFGVNPTYPDSYFDNGGNLRILEYPGDTHSGVNQYSASGPALGASTNQIDWLLQNLPVEHGSSGAPVYITDSNNQPFITGVVSELSSSEGIATRITQSKLNWIVSQLDNTSTDSSSTPGAPTANSTVAVFNPATAAWYLRDSNSPGAPAISPFQFGGAGWMPVVGDWNGDGLTTIGVVDPSATWYLKNSNSPGAPDVAPFRYGMGNWIPVVGDWDGNGSTTIGMFDPTTGTWYLKNSNSPGAPDYTPFQYGAPGWIPVVGDWNGDGTTTIGVVNPATMTWYLRNENSPGAPDIKPFQYGAPGWIPVVGDWNADGTTTVGVVDPTTETWYLRNENSPGAPDIQPFPYGAAGWLPLAGNWSGVAAPQSNTNTQLALDHGLTDAALYAVATSLVPPASTPAPIYTTSATNPGPQDSGDQGNAPPASESGGGESPLAQAAGGDLLEDAGLAEPLKGGL